MDKKLDYKLNHIRDLIVGIKDIIDKEEKINPLIGDMDPSVHMIDAMDDAQRCLEGTYTFLKYKRGHEKTMRFKARRLFGNG